MLIDELKAHAEALGFESELIEKSLKNRHVEKKRIVPAAQPFPVLPQKQRKEARKRLKEQVNRTAKLLLNRLGLDFGGHDMAFRLAPGVTGNNFVAAVQSVYHSLNKILGIKAGEWGKLKTEDYVRAMGSLEEILNLLTRQFKGRMKENE